MIAIRDGSPDDLPAVARIQSVSPEAAQWPPSDYMQYSFRVAVTAAGEIAGFLVYRGTGPDEWELLNIAVDPMHRRAGIGGALLGSLPNGRIYLEVGESNRTARSLYLRAGFTEISVRRGYYTGSGQDGIVMAWQK